MIYPSHLSEDDRAFHFFMGERKLTLFNGDILTLVADALVCPVDRNLDFRSGIARVVSQAAGKNVRSERPSFPEPFGKVVVLPGGNLKVRYLFLSVLLGEKEPEKMRLAIRQAVERSIRYAEFLRLKSIAFPLLGCPKTTPPYHLIAQETLKTVIQYLHRRHIKLKAIFLSVYNQDAYHAFRQEIKDIANL